MRSIRAIDGVNCIWVTAWRSMRSATPNVAGRCRVARPANDFREWLQAPQCDIRVESRSR